MVARPLERFLMAGCALAALGMATAAAAQVQAPAVPATEAPSQGIAEVVVTANRVATLAQDTPITLNAYSGDTLRSQGVETVRDLALIDPSINVSTTSGAAYIAVRGIASTDFTEIGDPSVPIARDGFFMNRSYSINSSMYDLSRIEVLKGPQGTLNGRNSTGGLISVITNRPTMTNSSYGSLDVGNYGTVIGEVGTNLVLADGLSVRASGLFNRHDGYRKLDGPGRDGDDEDFASGRLQAQYHSGGLTLWASYQHDSRDVNGDAVLRTALGGPEPDLDGKVNHFPSNTPIYTRLEGDRYRWEAAYSGLAGLNFIYSGGYDAEHWRNALDLSGPAYPADRQFVQSEQPGTWNNEVRVSNDKGQRLFFQAGYFRFEENNSLSSGAFNLDATGPFAPGGPLAALAQVDVYGIKFDYHVHTVSQAVFGQAEYDLTDRLQLSVGGRYTWDDKVRTGQAVLFLPALASPFAPPLTLVTPGNGQLSQGKPTWHVGLNYRPAKGSLLYVKYDRGYKSGGFNSDGDAPSVPYGPETLDAYEAGAKNTILNGKLRINVAAFYFDYSGYQADQSTPVLSGGSGIFNVGSARILGAEAEMIALLTPKTRLNVNVSGLDTKFGDNINVLDGTGALVPIGGKRLPNAPGFTASAGLEHGFSVGDGELTARVDVHYSSDFYYSVFNQADTRSPSYALANASLKYAPGGGVWDIQLYVRNMFDENVLSYAARNYIADTNTYQFQPPRTFGVRGAVRF